MDSAILFDLDNTLTHRQKSIEVYSQTFVSHFSEHLNNLNNETVCSLILSIDNGGYPSKKIPHLSLNESIINHLIHHLDWKNPQDIPNLIEHWRHYFPQSSVPMPGLHDIFKWLKEEAFLIGIVSNGAKDSRIQTTQHLGIENQVDLILSSEEAQAKKPDAKIFEMALKQLKVATSFAWFVGDNPITDMLGARRIGLKAIWLKGFHTWPKGVTKPQWEVNALHQIPEIVSH